MKTKKLHKIILKFIKITRNCLFVSEYKKSTRCCDYLPNCQFTFWITLLMGCRQRKTYNIFIFCNIKKPPTTYTLFRIFLTHIAGNHLVLPLNTMFNPECFHVLSPAVTQKNLLGFPTSSFRQHTRRPILLNPASCNTKLFPSD